MLRSTVLLSISMRPSSMKRVRPSQWLQHTLAASPAAVPWTHNALDPVLHRNDVEGFLDGLPDLVQLLAAAGADVALDIDHDIDARQMLRKLPPVASRRSLSTALRSVRQPASGHVIVGGGTSRLCRDGEERQLSEIQCLGAGTEDRAPVRDRIIRSLSFSWIAASRWAIAASRAAESELHSAA